MRIENTEPDDPHAWRLQAACRGMDVQLFYPEKWDGETTMKAIAVCETCSVREPCLDRAIQDREPGVWGGMSERRRRVKAAEIGRIPYLAPISHGTEAGYKMHRRRLVPVCDACRIAHRAYVTSTRKERP